MKHLFVRWGWAALLTACFLVFLNAGLNEPDEGRYAEIGREMAVVDGDWFTPHQNGFQHYQKPPLLYWATASSLKVFGVHIWAARLPSALAAIGTLALTAWLTRKLLGADASKTAALVLASSIGFFALARLLTPDMFMTFWITATISSAVKRYRGGSEWWGAAFFVCMGLGFMTKGPMALVVPLFATLGMRWATPAAERPRIPWLIGMILTLSIGLSWFVGQSLAHRKLYDYFVVDELVARISSGKHGRSKPWWFFIGVLPIAFLPWSVFAPCLLRTAWQRWRRKIVPGPFAALLLGWVVPPFIILSLAGSKLATYILPLLPALSIGVVAWCRAHWQRHQNAKVTTDAAMTPGRVGVPPADSRILRESPSLDSAPAVISRPAILHRVAVGMLIVLVIASAFRDKAAPWLRQQAGTNELAAIVRAQPDFATATIFAARVRAQGFTFCTGRLTCITKDESDLVLKLSDEQHERSFRDNVEIEQEMWNRPSAYGLVSREDIPTVFPPERWREMGTAGEFVLIGRIGK